jgi:hypothetical protein
MATPAAPMFRPCPPERSMSIVIESENAPMVNAPPSARTTSAAPNERPSDGTNARRS